MKTSEYDTKVKLKVDLIKYHPSLKVGIKGVTAGRQGIWSRNQDRFITVKFPEHTLDVLWESLEEIKVEKESLEEKKKRKRISDTSKIINQRMRRSLREEIRRKYGVDIKK